MHILGTEYTLAYSNENEDPMLKTCDGYCDKTTRRIVVSEKMKDCDLGDFDEYQKKVTRHEIIHAFLFESGLHGDAIYKTDSQEHPEMLIDWFAVQFPKILIVFRDANVLPKEMEDTE